jgi:hypothetical protein
MHRSICAVMSIATLVATSGAASPAVARGRSVHPSPEVIQDRYCLQGKIWGYPGNCLFSTYEQCMATASGTLAYCGLNPIYAFREWQGYR